MNYIKKKLRNIAFVKNLQYLLYNKLEDKESDLYDVIEDYYFRYLKTEDAKKNTRKELNVLSVRDSEELILKQPRSFCRFGDGEVFLMNGKDLPFQKYNPILAKKLKEILANDNDSYYVGLPYCDFYYPHNLTERSKKYYRLNGRFFREFFFRYCNDKRTYIDSMITIYYMNYKADDYEKHFENIKKMIEGKKIALFAGENVFSNIRYNIFDVASEIQFIKCPSRNAFSKYDDILNEAKKITNEYILGFILGPTAKPLVDELSRCGYTAWDVGHLIKDYDAYMTRIEQTDENTIAFFEPD